MSLSSENASQKEDRSDSKPWAFSELPSPWKFVFKNDSWLKEVLKLQTDGGYDPVPCIGGAELPRLWSSTNESLAIYLFLFVNDANGDTHFLVPEADASEQEEGGGNDEGAVNETDGSPKAVSERYKTFFDSLHSHEYHPELSQVTFKDSGLRLYVHDIVSATEDPRPIVMPMRLFNEEKDGRGVYTYVNYYEPERLDVTGPERIGPELIGGIQGVTWEEKQAVKDLCSLRLKFRNGQPYVRFLHNSMVFTRFKAIYEGGSLVGFKKVGREEESSNELFFPDCPVIDD